MARSQWLLWQLADSAFPAGGLAHSNGLEAAVQHQVVSTSADLEAFLHVTLRQAARGPLGFVQATRQDPGEFESVDSDCDIFLNNHVANRASRAQGRSFLAAADRIFSSPMIRALSEQVRARQMPAHFAPVFGVIAAALGLDQSQTNSLYLFILARSCVGSAVRLGIVGPLEGQRIQSRIQIGPIDREAAPVQTAPLLDLLQATQDRLYSRLFQS